MDYQLPKQIEFDNFDDVFQAIKEAFDQDGEAVVIDCQNITQINSLLLSLLIYVINESYRTNHKLSILAVPEALYAFCGDSELVNIIQQFAG